MHVALRLKGTANRADAPVHHVAGGNDVDTATRLSECLLCQNCNSLIVHDVAVGVEQSVLAVGCERVQCNVGHQPQFREALLQCAHDGGYQPLWVESFAAVFGFQRRIKHRKQRHHRYSQLQAFFSDRQKTVQAAPLHAGHGGHILSLPVASQHEHRKDQVCGVQVVLAHQGARELISAQTPRSAQRVGRRNVHRRWARAASAMLGQGHSAGRRQL